MNIIFSTIFRIPVSIKVMPAVSCQLHFDEVDVDEDLEELDKS